jgi:hypothetical protein
MTNKQRLAFLVLVVGMVAQIGLNWITDARLRRLEARVLTATDPR